MTRPESATGNDSSKYGGSKLKLRVMALTLLSPLHNTLPSRKKGSRAARRTIVSFVSSPNMLYYYRAIVDTKVERSAIVRSDCLSCLGELIGGTSASTQL